MKNWLTVNKIKIITSALVVGFLCLVVGVMFADAVKPADPSSLQQYINGTSTAIVNGVWMNNNNLYLFATSSDSSNHDFVVYYQLATTGQAFLTATSEPAIFCDQGTPHSSCSGKVWSNATTTSNWFNTSYKYRQTITLKASKVAGALTNFPVYFNLANLNAANNFWPHTKKNSDGGDLVITSSDGTSRLPLQIVSISTSTKSGEIHFLPPSISSSSDIVFYLYYGSSTAAQPAASATYGSQSVWDSVYKAVYHLNEDGNNNSAGYKDSTSYVNHGTGTSMTVSSDIAAKLGLGQDFDGVNDYITVKDSSSLDINGNGLALSMWINQNSAVSGNQASSSTIRPTGAGAAALLTAVGQTPNWNCVEEISSDGDTSYVRSNNASLRADTYALANPSAVGTITSVVNNINCRCEATTGTCSGATRLRTNSTNYDGPTISPAYNVYTTYSSSTNKNLNTGAPWSWTDINNLEAGMNIRGWSAMDLDTFRARCTQNWVEVNYTTPAKIAAGKGISAYEIQINTTGYIRSAAIATSSAINVWQNLVLTHDGSNSKMYVNGSEEMSTVNAGPVTVNNSNFIISSYVNGTVDEIRIASSTRSLKWIQTEYNNQNSPETFFSTSTEQYYLTTSKKAINIPGVSESSVGYKWQSIACDLDAKCSSWIVFNASTPNFRVDTIKPTAPGNLIVLASTTHSIKLQFGAASTETNFEEYKIYYRIGSTTAPTEADMLFSSTSDANLASITFNGKSSTTISGLTGGTWYSFSIFAYDQSGQKASSTYVIQKTNSNPTGIFNSAALRTDATGVVDISFTTSDPDLDTQLRAKIDYVYGANCDFASPLDPTLDLTDANTTAIQGDPKVDNSEIYQIGSSTGWITTAGGANTINFNWLSKIDLNNATGTYCLRLLVDDNKNGSSTYATTTVFIDNLASTKPGDLFFSKRTANSITPAFGAASDDDSFFQYKIYYKVGASGVAETDSFIGSSTDSNLSSINYGGAATTTISGLLAGTTYVFNIFAYDLYGNKASATTEFSYATKIYASLSSALEQYKNNGTIVLTNGSWTSGNSIQLFATSTDVDGDTATIYYQLATTSGTFITATTTPAACSSGTAYSACPGRIWYSSGSAKVNITAIPDSNTGYKWQALACDVDGCSKNWTEFNASAPNFKVDNTAPTAPGALTAIASTTNSIKLQFGSATVEDNFEEYKIYYRIGSTTAPTESDLLFSSTTDINLASITFNGKSSTTISGLTGGTWYSFSIFAYDQSGQKASSSYIAQKTNSNPTGIFNSAALRTDASGIVVISFTASDPDLDTELRAKIDYVLGTACNFASPLDPTLDLTDANTTAIQGDPKVDNSEIYQIGSSTGWITTAGGANTINFNWLSKIDLNNATGTYCLRLLVDDNKNGSSTYATTTVFIDNLAPTKPGNLTLLTRSAGSINFNFGAASDEDSFFQYKIYYKVGASGVAENDFSFGSSSEANLGYVNYNGSSTVTVTGLSQGTQYVFNIFVYDSYGNKASATTEISVTTKHYPNIPSSLNQYGSNGLTLVENGEWLTANTVVLHSVSSDLDDDSNTIYYQLATTSGTFIIATATPVGACSSGTAYNSCPGKIWHTAGSDVSIPSISDSAAGYKWQAFSCDIDGCSIWAVFNVSTPNFRIDTILPTAPGALIVLASTTDSIKFQFGSPTIEDNFKEYKIYYRIGSTTAPTEADMLFSSTSDANLASKTFNGKSSTTISGLLTGTRYAFAIFAYDQAGNKASSSYVWQRVKSANVGTINSLSVRKNGSGVVDVEGIVNDDNEQNVRVRVEYEAGETCAFSSHLKATIDETDANTTALKGDPKVDANEDYPIGTTTGVISTYDGANTINFDWLSDTDLPNGDGVYCLKIIVNDYVEDIASSIATTTIDNAAPAGLGNLSLSSKRYNSLTLAFGAQATETNFDQYKIFYKAGSSGVTEANTLFGSTSDANLASQAYGGQSTTTISSLSEGVQYVFNIFAYDDFGNKSSAASELTATTNSRSTGSIVSATQRNNSTGVVDITTLFNDADGDNLVRAKLEYVLGGACNFSSPLDPTLDETDYTATSTYGDAKIENDNDSQIGNSSGWILTSSGANTVSFDWLSPLDLPNIENTYCLRLTANDNFDNQAVSATRTVIIDNKNPSNPGVFTLNKKTASSLILNFGAQSSDLNFKEYKLFYVQGTGAVTEASNQHIDSNLGYQNFNGKSTTTIIGLLMGTEYSFKIFAYDNYGNKSSSTQFSFVTNARPIGKFNSAAQRINGSGIIDISIEVSDLNGDPSKAKLEYVSGAGCNFSSPLDPTLDETDANTTATQGDPKVDNSETYQIGSSTGWIITNQGTNIINFDWLSKSDLDGLSGTYCLRLTVNDGTDDQVATTAILTIDNQKPTNPGNLLVYKVVGNRVTLAFGAPSSEDNFNEYKIFYKQGISGVAESDSVFTQNNFYGLGNIDYSSAATTTIISLVQEVDYVFNIFVYDNYGNKASATNEVSTTTLVNPAASWREAEDTVDPTVSSYLGKEENVRVRISLVDVSPFVSPSYEYKIQYSPKTAACSVVTEWVNMAVSTTTGPFEMVDSDNFNNQEATVQRLTNLEGYTFVPGYMVKYPDNKSAGLVLDNNQYTEMEYSFWATAAAQAGQTYCFRLLSDDKVLNAYNQYPELTIAPPPTSSFIAALQLDDGLNVVRGIILVGDYNGDLSRAKIEYVASSSCNFSSPLRPTLDESDAGTIAIYGDPDTYNVEDYQVGSTTGNGIVTAYGSNMVAFSWLTNSDFSGIDDTYCLRATVNDGFDDQLIPATTTVVIDQISPTVPGNLVEYSKGCDDVTFLLGATSSDTNFREYRIYYKEGSSGVTENDAIWDLSNDPNLDYVDYNGAIQTTITGLTTNKQYVFRIFAYDNAGHGTPSYNETVVDIGSEKISGDWRWYNDRNNETPASPPADVNTAPSDVNYSNILKLRMAFKNSHCSPLDENIKLRIEYSTYPDFSADVGFLGEIGSTSSWTYGDGVDEDNSQITTLVLATTTAKMTHNESGLSSSPINQTGETWDEWEFTIKNNNATPGTTYYFRGYNNTTNRSIEPSVSHLYPSAIASFGSLSFMVSGLVSGTSTEGVITNISTVEDSIDFGQLLPNNQVIGAQRFTITTNAEYGYKLYAYSRTELISSGGAVINPVVADNDAPAAWPVAPNPSNFGYHVGDDALSGNSPSRFAANNTYAKFETTMKEIGYSSIPVSEDIFDLIFRTEVSSLQPTGSYQSNIVYILVPTF